MSKCGFAEVVRQIESILLVSWVFVISSYFFSISTAFPSELICSAEPEANWLLSVNDGWQRQQFVILHESLKPPIRELHEVSFLLNLKEGPEKENRWWQSQI